MLTKKFISYLIYIVVLLDGFISTVNSTKKQPYSGDIYSIVVIFLPERSNCMW